MRAVRRTEYRSTYAHPMTYVTYIKIVRSCERQYQSRTGMRNKANNAKASTPVLSTTVRSSSRVHSPSPKVETLRRRVSVMERGVRHVPFRAVYVRTISRMFYAKRAMKVGFWHQWYDRYR